MNFDQYCSMNAKKKVRRKSVGKRVRFEVFKRDAFTCQYCGATPPSIVLHVDHIIPVSDGGSNEIDNLVTSCQPCNSGKSNISLKSIPKSLKQKAEEIAEREEQLRGYQEVLDAKRQRIEDELWEVAEIIEPGCSEKGMRRDQTMSIRRFIEKIGKHACLEAAEIARAALPYGGKRTFLYFAKVCWNKINDTGVPRA